MSCGYLWFQPRASPGFDGWIMLVREEFETEDQAIYCEKKRLAAVGGVKEETLRDAGVKLDTIGLHVDCGIIYNPPDDGDERTWVLEYFKERMIDFVADDDELVERLLHHQEAVHDEQPLHDDGRDDAPSPPGGDKAASDDDDPLPREGGDPSSYAPALGRSAPAPSVAPPPPPPSQPASAADLLHLRRERLRTLWLRTEERAAIVLQRRWRVLQATEEATSRRLVHAAAAVADLEAAGHFQQASETMAAAMVAAKQQHDRIIRNAAATHITRFFLRLRRRAAARQVHELAATAEGKRHLAAIHLQAAARRLLAIDLRRRLATPVVRLGICWGASAGDALPLRLEVAPPVHFGDDAAPPGIFEVEVPPASAPTAAPAAAEAPSTDEAAPRARPATPDLKAPSAMLPSLRNAPILSAACASPTVVLPTAASAAVAATVPPRAPTTAGAPGAAATAAAAPMASCSLAAADAGSCSSHIAEPSSSPGRLPPLARQPATAKPAAGSAGAGAGVDGGAAVAPGRRVGSSSGGGVAAVGAGAAAASSADGAAARAALLLSWPVRAGLRGSVAQQSERGSPGKEGKGNRSSWFKAAMAPFKSASVFVLQLSCAGASWSTTHTYKEILAFDAQLRAAQQQHTPQPPVGSGAAVGLPDLPLAGGRVIRLGAVQAWLAALLDGLTAGALAGGTVLLLGTFLQLQLPPLVRLQACARGWRARRRRRQADGQQLAGSAPG